MAQQKQDLYECLQPLGLGWLLYNFNFMSEEIKAQRERKLPISQDTQVRAGLSLATILQWSHPALQSQMFHTDSLPYNSLISPEGSQKKEQASVAKST